MVTGQQVRRLRQKLMQGKTQEAAAAAAGMSVRSAGKWQRGLLLDWLSQLPLRE